MKRLLLPVMALAILLLAVPVSRAADPDPDTPVFTSGVASGDVTPTRAILWTRVDRRTSVKLEVWDNPALAGQKAFQKTIPQTSAARDFTVKVDATGLTPGTQYYYRFRHEQSGGGNVLSPVGTFRTAPDPSQPADVSFTYTGDSDGTKVGGVPQHGTFDVLAAAQNENADFFSFNGDTIYSDSHHRPTGPATTLDEYRDAHEENRTYANLSNLLASTSTYPGWDDHEVQNDYDGQTVDPARFAAGTQAFREWMPLRETGLLHDTSCAGDPLYRKYSWGSEVDLFVIDTRVCRSADVAVNPCLGDLAPTLPPFIRPAFGLPPNPPPGCLAAIFNPARTLLGPVQKAQFKNDLQGSTAKWKFVINPEPIQQFWALPYDRWEGYGAERNEILDFISNNGISNVLFTTTDTHATIQNQVFKDRFTAPGTVANELITGPIGTETFQTEVLAFGGPSALLGVNQAMTGLAMTDCRHLDKNSYASVDIDTTAGTSTMASKDDTGAVIEDQNVPSVFCTKTFGP